MGSSKKRVTIFWKEHVPEVWRMKTRRKNIAKEEVDVKIKQTNKQKNWKINLTLQYFLIVTKTVGMDILESIPVLEHFSELIKK